MRIFILLTALVGFTQPLLSQTNYYTVKFPDDQTFIGCNANVPVTEPVITQYGCNINVGISRYDQVFNTNESGTCFKILRRWRLLYWCDYNANILPTYINNPTSTDVGPTVIGNSANHGYLEYVQVIKVHDVDPPVFSNCPADKVVFCDYTNNNTALYSYPPHYDYCEGPVNLEIDVSDVCSGLDITLGYRLWLDMDSNGSMETYINSSDANAWPIEQTTPANLLHGKIQFPAGFQLPYGTHKIEWIAGDHCGNEALCKYEFEVRDCKNPTIVCINGLSVNLMQSGMITMWASDFVQYISDNCTPSDQIKIAIRKSGTGTGFPTGSTGVTFDCNETGTQLVEIWGLDLHGNADYCETYVNVQDNMGICAPTASLSGVVMKSNGDPMAGATLTVKKPNQSVALTAETNANGQTGPLALIPGCYTLVPSMNTTGPATGISAWDALLVDLHEYAVNNFDQPWQFAAADVNQDGILTAGDVSAIVQMAIGATSQWPGVANWQFIPASATVPASTIAFPATQQVCVANNAPGASAWTAVKSGDLDGSGTGNQLTGSDLEDRSTKISRNRFTAFDQVFEAGETVEVTLFTPSNSQLAGFQVALQYDPAILQLAGTTPALAPEQQIKRLDETSEVRAGWVDATAFLPEGIGQFAAKPAFTLSFTALEAGQLSEYLHLNTESFVNEAYTSAYTKKEVGLRFIHAPESAHKPQLFAPVPNPVRGETVTASYLLPENTTARIHLTDLHGRTIAEQSVAGEAGYHEVAIPMGSAHSGTLIMQLVTDGGVSAKKIEVYN